MIGHPYTPEISKGEMPSLVSPQRPATISRPRAGSALPPPLPPKTIDLNSSTRSTDQHTGAKVTRRAFLCDVVVEGEGLETPALLAALGCPMPLPSCLVTSQSAALMTDKRIDDYWSPTKAGEQGKRLDALIEELIRTERSYLARIKALKLSYADPLRTFARGADSRIIPLYEAKSLFANIDDILPAAAAFSADLEAASGSSIGEICLRHLKTLRAFDPYRVYLGKQDESQKIFQEVFRKFTGFGSFIESTRYQTTGIGNIGLRELLMEPVQRIPRYTLLWQAMMKCLPSTSMERVKLLEACEIASGIAKCEPDSSTVRATIMYCLERNIDGFPAELFSNHRDYIDSIDVDDIPVDSIPSFPDARLPGHTRPVPSTSSSTPSLTSLSSGASSQGPMSTSYAPLHATLFLFTDKIIIVKRQAGGISGRRATGLDDVPKLIKAGGGVAVMDKGGNRRDKLAFRGMIDVLEVIATDVGNGDFYLYFERPPQDQTERWSRPFRSYTTVQPPYTSLDRVAIRKEKLRFIENLWAVQASIRAKHLPKDVSRPPAVLAGIEEYDLDRTGEMLGRARCFWNVWDRKGWMVQVKKAKVTVHVDAEGSAPELPQNSGTLLMIRLQPLSGGLSRFSCTAIGEAEEERVVLDTVELPERIVMTIHRFGIFKFRTSAKSCPVSPSSTGHRLRPSMLNLDAISRNLFGTGSVSSRSQASTDLLSNGQRSSVISRTSTTETERFSIDMRSTSSKDDSEKRLSRQSSSPSDRIPVTDLPSGSPYKAPAMGQSEVDLNERLNLARKNSKSMAALSPEPKRSLSRLGSKSVAKMSVHTNAREALHGAEAALQSASDQSRTPINALRIRNKTPSPSLLPETAIWINQPANLPEAPHQMASYHSNVVTLEQHEISEILMSSPKNISSPIPLSVSTIASLSPRPLGPRNPVPRLPIAGLGSVHTKLRVVSGGGRRVSPGRDTIPLKGDTTPITLVASKRQHSEDELQARKRSPTHSPYKLPDDPGALPSALRIPSLTKRTPDRRISVTPRRSSGPLTTARRVSASNTSLTSVATSATVEANIKEPYKDFGSALDATRGRLVESRAMVKRLKADVSQLRKQFGRDVKTPVTHLDRQPSLPRSPQRRNIHRLVDFDSVGYDNISVSWRQSNASQGKHEVDTIVTDEIARGITSLVDRLDTQLRQALADRDLAATLAEKPARQNEEKSAEIEDLQIQLNKATLVQGLLRHQLSEVQTELDVIYEAFNSELDGMFNDARLPETEAFYALRRDLQSTKAKRNELALENQRLRQELCEANLM